MERPKGYASMVDTHRNDSNGSGELSENAFPTVEKLRRLGINKVIYLCEASVGEMAETWEELSQKDFSQVPQRGEYWYTPTKLDLSKKLQIDLSQVSLPKGKIIVDNDVNRYLDILHESGFEIKRYGIDSRQGRF